MNALISACLIVNEGGNVFKRFGGSFHNQCSFVRSLLKDIAFKDRLETQLDSKCWVHLYVPQRLHEL